MKTLPYARQVIDDADIAAVVETLKSDYLTTGPKVAAFEAAICQVTGAKEAIVCSNATAGLHLAALALDLGPGDCVVVPSITFLATANAVRYTGADVVFADVHPRTALMEPQHLVEALTRCQGKKPRAVFPVHMAGTCVDLLEIKKIATQQGIHVVADAAHAFGGHYRDVPVGACQYEDMSVFSFHAVKTIAMGEGGAITTNNPVWAQKLRTLRSHGMVRKPDMGPWYYEMADMGYNFRATDMQCALGLSQVKKLDKFVKRRREMVALYDQLLTPLNNVITRADFTKDTDPAWHLYQVQIDFAALGVTRMEFMKRLLEKGVGAQVHYIPVHQQPYYQKLYGAQDLPGAQEFYDRTLSLPLYPALSDDDIAYVVDTIRSLVS